MDTPLGQVPRYAESTYLISKTETCSPSFLLAISNDMCYHYHKYENTDDNKERTQNNGHSIDNHTADNIGYRYGLVAVDNDNNPTYLGANSEAKKTLTYKNPGNIKRLYLVVVGCPSKEYRPESFGFGRRRGQQQAETAQEGPATYPYQIKVIG